MTHDRPYPMLLPDEVPPPESDRYGDPCSVTGCKYPEDCPCEQATALTASAQRKEHEDARDHE